MIRLLASAVVSLLSNAVALLVASAVLEDMTLEPLGLVIAAAIFTVVMVLATPLLRQVAVTKASALIGSTALVATLVSLMITAVVSDAMTIDGATTWIAATVLVWVLAVIGRLLLPLVIFREALAHHDERQH